MLDQEFKLKPSKWYLGAIALLLIGSVAIVIYLPLTIGIQLGALLFIAVYGALLWRLGLLRSRRSIISLRRLSDGHWYVKTPVRGYVGQLRGDSTVTTKVSVLRFQIEKRRLPISCLLFPDSFLHKDYRKLLMLMLSSCEVV